MEIKPATRQAVRPLICFYAESGCGKTYSALLLARGFVGPTGRIILADTENGRGSLYADVLPNGYDVIQVTDPFNPTKAIQCIETIEQSGAAIGILDSGSHFWEGIGGVLDQAGANEEKSGKQGLHNWRTPKMDHQKFVGRLLRSSIPWIICLRAKHKTRQSKVDGKTVIIKDDYTTPLQAEDFIFEMTVHCEIMQDHTLRPTKVSHPGLAACFPAGQMVTENHGRILAEWCANPKHPKQPEPDQRKVLLADLWAKLKPVRGDQKNWTQAEVWLVDKGLIHDTELILEMDYIRLNELAAAIKKVEIESEKS